MRELTRQERAAMWLYHDEYAAQTKGAIAFWRDLSPYQQRTVDRMIADILGAEEGRDG